MSKKRTIAIEIEYKDDETADNLYLKTVMEFGRYFREYTRSGEITNYSVDSAFKEEG